jgi:hypothetical protein
MGAAPTMNRSAKGGARSSLHYEGEGVLIHPPHQGVCGRYGTEEQRVTSGGLAGSSGGTGVSGPISESEMASNALSVVGRLNSTRSTAKAMGPGNRRRKWVGEDSRRRRLGRERTAVSKDGKVDQFHE